MQLYHVDDAYDWTSEPYNKLALVVVWRAAKDYRLMGRKLCAGCDPVETKQLSGRMKEISRFLLSDWYEVLSGREDGAKVLELMDQEVFGDD